VAVQSVRACRVCSRDINPGADVELHPSRKYCGERCARRSRLTVRKGSVQAGRALAIWALENDLEMKEIAAKIGASAHSVSRWRNGWELPSADYPIRIEELTGGKIPARDWYKKEAA
jgi:hypothetical protein